MQNLNFVALPVPEKLGSPWIRPRSLSSKIFNGLLNVLAKFEICSFSRSWDNRGVPKKFRQSLGTPTLLFLQNFSWAFVRMDPLNILAKFDIRSFSRSWDNRGYLNNLGSPWIRPRFFFSKMFHGLLFGWTLWIYWPNLKSVALPVPEIIGGTQTIWAVPGYAHASFSPKCFMGFCSDGPSEYTGQIWNE